MEQTELYQILTAIIAAIVAVAFLFDFDFSIVIAATLVLGFLAIVGILIRIF